MTLMSIKEVSNIISITHDLRINLVNRYVGKRVRLLGGSKRWRGRLARIEAVMIDDRQGPLFLAMVMYRSAEGLSSNELRSIDFINGPADTRTYWPADKLELA